MSECSRVILALFRAVNRYVSNLQPMPGVFPSYPAPVIRNEPKPRTETRAELSRTFHLSVGRRGLACPATCEARLVAASNTPQYVRRVSIARCRWHQLAAEHVPCVLLVGALQIGHAYNVAVVIQKVSSVVRRPLPKKIEAQTLAGLIIGPSPQSFNERSLAERIVRRQKRTAKHCRVVWQLAIGKRVHIAHKRGDRVPKISSVEMIESPLLALLDIPVARHLN